MASVSFFRPPLDASVEQAGPSQRDSSCELDFFFEEVESFDEASASSIQHFGVHRRHRLRAHRRPGATPIDIRSLRGGFRDKAPPPKPAPPPPPQKGEKTITDVIAGALARALSQSTIHPLDTLKVRMQAPPGALSKFGQLVPPPGSGRPRWSKRATLRHGVKYRNKKAVALSLSRAGREFASLYRGVFGAASGAGVIIGTYFAFYSSTKKYLTSRVVDRETGEPLLSPGTAAFAAGATAAVGSSVVKVPLAVCIRSVQAGVYPNVFAAAARITRAAGARGLFTGFVPTLLEDVPDMGVKFAVYESLRAAHARLTDGRPPTTAEDLLIGGTAGACAAAATTPLDVLKTGMMVSAARRPTMAGALAAALERGGGPRALFAGVGPRALSNGLNSAVFFCFFEAIRGGLVAAAAERERRSKARKEADASAAAAAASAAAAAAAKAGKKSKASQNQQQQLRISLPRLQLFERGSKPAQLV